MKHKILPVIAILFFSSYALNAQIEKGNVLLGGTIGYGGSSGSISNSTSNAGFSPRIGYAIARNTVLGLSGSFNYNRAKAPNSNDKSTYTSYGTAVYLRKYMPVQNKLGWYAEASAGISSSTSKEVVFSINRKSTSRAYGVNVVPGVYYQALPRLIINANVGGASYYYGKYSGNDTTVKSHYSTVSVNFLSSFSFGIDFILSKKA